MTRVHGVTKHFKEEEPHLRQIQGGWAASGKGWAVHGATQDEAIQRFQAAVEQHKVIAARPYWYEQLQALMNASSPSNN